MAKAFQQHQHMIIARYLCLTFFFAKELELLKVMKQSVASASYLNQRSPGGRIGPAIVLQLDLSSETARNPLGWAWRGEDGSAWLVADNGHIYQVMSHSATASKQLAWALGQVFS